MSASAASRSSEKSAELVSRSQSKGAQTRLAILDKALEIACRHGLEGLTIGALAERMRMSKSGVFAHFGSREDLQIAVIHEYNRRFEAEVFYTGIQFEAGLPRFYALLRGWLARHTVEIESGCIYISGAVEYDDRPGPIRDELVEMVKRWNQSLLRAARQAVEVGHLLPETDCEQLTYEARALILTLHHDARFLQEADAVHKTERALARLIHAHAVEKIAFKTLAAQQVKKPATKWATKIEKKAVPRLAEVPEVSLTKTKTKTSSKSKRLTKGKS